MKERRVVLFREAEEELLISHLSGGTVPAPKGIVDGIVDGDDDASNDGEPTARRFRFDSRGRLLPASPEARGGGFAAEASPASTKRLRKQRAALVSRVRRLASAAAADAATLNARRLSAGCGEGRLLSRAGESAPALPLRAPAVRPTEGVWLRPDAVRERAARRAADARGEGGGEAEGEDPCGREATLRRAASEAAVRRRQLQRGLHWVDGVGQHRHADVVVAAAQRRMDLPDWLTARPDFQQLWLQSRSAGMMARQVLEKPHDRRTRAEVRRLRDWLRSIHFVAALSEEMQLAVARVVTGRPVYRGEIVYRAGDPAASILMVRKGTVVTVRRGGLCPEDVAERVLASPARVWKASPYQQQQQQQQQQPVADPSAAAEATRHLTDDQVAALWPDLRPAAVDDVCSRLTAGVSAARTRPGSGTGSGPGAAAPPQALPLSAMTAAAASARLHVALGSFGMPAALAPNSAGAGRDPLGRTDAWRRAEAGHPRARARAIELWRVLRESVRTVSESHGRGAAASGSAAPLPDVSGHTRLLGLAREQEQRQQEQQQQQQQEQQQQHEREETAVAATDGVLVSLGEDQLADLRTQMRTLERRECVRTFKTTPLFRSFPLRRLRALALVTETVRYRRGDTVGEQDGAADAVFVVSSGRLAVRRRVGLSISRRWPVPGGRWKVGSSARASQFDTASLGPGDVFGFEALLHCPRFEATAACRADSTVLRIPRRNFCMLLQARELKAVRSIVSQARDAAIQRICRHLRQRYPDPSGARKAQLRAARVLPGGGGGEQAGGGGEHRPPANRSRYQGALVGAMSGYAASRRLERAAHARHALLAAHGEDFVRTVAVPPGTELAPDSSGAAEERYQTAAEVLQTVGFSVIVRFPCVDLALAARPPPDDASRD